MKKLVLSTLFLASVLCAKEVNIGVVLPLTGAIANYGQDVLSGIEIANKMVPKLEDGTSVKIIALDTKGDKVESSTAALRLVSQDKAIGIIGEAITTNTMQVIQVAEENKIPMIAPVASGDRLLDNKKYSSRVCFTDSFQGGKLADYAVDSLNFKTAAIVIDQSNVYSLGLAKVFEAQLKKRGGKVLKKFMISSNDKDFKAIVSQLKSVNPDFVYLPIYHPEAALVVKQARAAGFTKPFTGADGLNNKTFIEIGGEGAEGVIFTDAFDSANPSTKIGKDFVSFYKKEKGSQIVPAFSAMGADAYMVFVNAMNKCKNSLTPECVNKEIRSTKNLQTVGGVVSIDSNGNAMRPVVVKQIKNKEQVYKATINP
ncbi:ABC transporter substrate-binding protein [uncultured Campylobacter sp.]|uniref:ABC transporter substrate-binding protein n=1 Tax=uncultured Campylobacter sp. TaxID=218934 RepID=UPI00262B4893|nr:ABC transporter substrate-binding protein [uncultured Campylobacter sp.]